MKRAPELRTRNWHIVNIDSGLIAEKPKLQPRLAKMKAALADLTGRSPDCIGIKATTNESVGNIGRSFLLATNTVVLIEQR